MKRFILKVGLVLVLVAIVCLTVPWQSGSPVALAQEKIDKAEAANKELVALQGTWKLMTHEEDGKDVPYGEDVQLYIVEKDKITVKRKGDVIAERPIELDATRSPKHLDFQRTGGQTELTIYIRVGDYFIQCGRRDGKTRPSEFATGTANGGEYLIVLKREK
jgi:uncharacterized protein (TIGR03067 family)